MFGEIYRRREWGSAESVSGEGSELGQTERLRASLPQILRDLGVRTMVDVPCGDFHWMRLVDLPVDRYIGADVVPELVEANIERHAAADREFILLDATASRPPTADLIFCRDMLVHLSDGDIERCLTNFVDSGARYLMTTTFLEPRPHVDIETGSWRPLHLTGSPFEFPTPSHLLVEGCTVEGGRWADKAMGVWLMSDVEASLSRKRRRRRF